MHVVAAVDGQVTAEISALYALHFARVLKLSLVLLHVRNQKDNPDVVEAGMETLRETASEYGVVLDTVMLDGPPLAAVKNYLRENKVEIIFCGTGYYSRRRFRNPLFPDLLLAQKLPVDLAMVRVVHPHSTIHTKRVVLPIKGDRMSVEKFTFFASMAKAYKAGGEIYSVTVISKRKRAGLDFGETRKILQRIDNRLSHYRQLAAHMGIQLKCKHGVAENEIDRILQHLAHRDFHLMIIGGERLTTSFSLQQPRPIERLHCFTPVNTISFYHRGRNR